MHPNYLDSVGAPTFKIVQACIIGSTNKCTINMELHSFFMLEKDRLPMLLPKSSLFSEISAFGNSWTVYNELLWADVRTCTMDKRWQTFYSGSELEKRWTSLSECEPSSSIALLHHEEIETEDIVIARTVAASFICLAQDALNESANI